MTHGYWSSCTSFCTLLSHLSKQYDVVLFDNCGWGLNTRLIKCSGLESTDAAFKWLKDFICRTIDALELPETFLLAGHSFGGFICSVYATQRPHRIESLFLLSPIGLETYNPQDYDPLAYNE